MATVIDLNSIRDAVIAILQGGISGGYPKVVKPYAGELRALRDRKPKPKTVLVYIEQGDMTMDDTKADEWGGRFRCRILFYDHSDRSHEDHDDKINAGITWILKTIVGATFTSPNTTRQIRFANTAEFRKVIAAEIDNYIPVLGLVDIYLEVAY